MKTKPKKSLKPVAVLTIHGLNTMKPKKIAELAGWLYNKSDEIREESNLISEKHKRNYSKRFTARLFL